MEKFEQCLSTYLRVPPSHITFLRENEATHANIIQALQNLKTDSNISRGDSIFIFYAGHGAYRLETSITGQKKHLDKVKVKVPYDYNQGKKNVVSGYTLQALLSVIALCKGENIVRP